MPSTTEGQSCLLIMNRAGVRGSTCFQQHLPLIEESAVLLPAVTRPVEQGSELGQALQSMKVGFRLLQMRKCSFLCWQLSGMTLVIVSGVALTLSMFL